MLAVTVAVKSCRERNLPVRKHILGVGQHVGGHVLEVVKDLQAYSFGMFL